MIEKSWDILAQYPSGMRERELTDSRRAKAQVAEEINTPMVKTGIQQFDTSWTNKWYARLGITNVRIYIPHTNREGLNPLSGAFDEIRDKPTTATGFKLPLMASTEKMYV